MIHPNESKYAKDLIVGDMIHYSFTVKTIVSIEIADNKVHIKFSDNDYIDCDLFSVYFICNAKNSDDFVV